MSLSFNNHNQMSGLFILEIHPKSNYEKVELISVENEEYFIDGYKYGGFKDYSLRLKSDRTLEFRADNESYSALKED